ncbi:MAG: hypothetical protein AAF443_07110 [Chlamydiota bacterium]
MKWSDRSLSRPYRFFLRNWWVMVFLVLSWVFYLHELEKKKVRLTQLQQKKSRWEGEKKQALNEQWELNLRKQSQDDSESLELILKEKLGVIEPGEIKVVFESMEYGLAPQ